MIYLLAKDFYTLYPQFCFACEFCVLYSIAACHTRFLSYIFYMRSVHIQESSEGFRIEYLHGTDVYVYAAASRDAAQAHTSAAGSRDASVYVRAER